MTKYKSKFGLLFLGCLLVLQAPIVVQAKVPLCQRETAQAQLSHRTLGYVWRLDAPADETMPRNYRTMPSIKMSGSGQFTPLSYQNMLQDLQTKYKVKPQNVYIFDLRQESHGLLNGAAVSWYGEDNWSNVGKSPKKIAAEEKLLLKDTLKQNIVGIYHLDTHKVPHLVAGIKVTSQETEQQLVEQFGAHYVRITCPDHLWPGQVQREQFSQIYKQLPKDAWLHFHCQAGIGRTTSFMAMYDILRNGHNDSLETIIDRQHKLGGQDLLHVWSGEAWRQAINDDKARGVRDFYNAHK
jgi:hypothetical protein